MNLIKMADFTRLMEDSYKIESLPLADTLEGWGIDAVSYIALVDAFIASAMYGLKKGKDIRSEIESTFASGFSLGYMTAQEADMRRLKEVT